jgi:hypothetical protein
LEADNPAAVGALDGRAEHAGVRIPFQKLNQLANRFLRAQRPESLVKHDVATVCEARALENDGLVAPSFSAEAREANASSGPPAL